MTQRNNLLLLLSIFLTASSFIVYNGHHGKIITSTVQGNKIEFFAQNPDTSYFIDSQTHQKRMEVKSTEWVVLRLNGAPVQFNAFDTRPAFPPAVKAAEDTLYARVNAVLEPKIIAMGDGLYYADPIKLIYDQNGQIAICHGGNDLDLYPFDSIKRAQVQQQRPLLDSLLLAAVKSTVPFPVVKVKGNAVPYELNIQIGYRVKNGKFRKGRFEFGQEL